MKEVRSKPDFKNSLRLIKQLAKNLQISEIIAFTLLSPDMGRAYDVFEESEFSNIKTSMGCCADKCKERKNLVCMKCVKTESFMMKSFKGRYCAGCMASHLSSHT
jgi:hypothetical protein